MKLGLGYLLVYTDWIKTGFAGCSNGPIIRIRPKYKDDLGLEMHERQHIKQWWITLGLHSLLYFLSKKYRLWAEVSAYEEQLKYPPASGRDAYRKIYAGFISTKYGIKITVREAYEKLS